MTLVLTLASRDYVIQASDRRLTFPDSTLAEDEANKAVIYQASVIFAFTGLAHLKSEPMADWLLDAVVDAPEGIDLMESVRTSISSAFATLPRPGGVLPSAWRRATRTTVACVGFGHLSRPPNARVSESPAGVYPAMVITSNFEQQDGSLLAEASPTFGQFIAYLPDHQDLILKASGQSLRPAEKVRISRALRRCRGRTKAPEPVARILAHQILDVAERNSQVGRSVMCTILMRGATPSMGFVTGRSVGPTGELDGFRTWPDSTSIRFIYMASDPSKYTYYGPNTFTGTVALRGMKVEPTDAVSNGIG